ncbi:restriction endonuclease subunit S [Pseudomonadota bacterium]
MSSAVPDDWGIKLVSEVAYNLDGKRVPLKSTDRANRRGHYRYFGASGVLDYVDGYIFDGRYILVGEDGENVLSRNLPLAFIVSGKFWVNNHAHVLKPKDGVDLEYLCEYLESLDFSIIASGSAQPKITQGELNKVKVIFPPLPEQQKIAAILSSVDEVIEKTEAQIQKLKDLKTAMMQTLLTQGIGHTEFKDSPVGRIPVGWELKSIEELSSFVTSGSRGWAQYYSDSGAIFIRIGNLTRENINFRFDDVVYVNPPNTAEGKRTLVKEGDVLISITADLGVIGVVNSLVGEAYVNQHVSLVRLDDSGSARWVGHYLAFEDTQKQFIANNDGGAKAGLNLPSIRRTLVAMPSESERNKIVGTLDSIDKSISEKRRKLATYTNTKKALMQDLLTGKVRVKVN